MRLGFIFGLIFLFLLLIPQSALAGSIKIEPAFVEVKLIGSESEKTFEFFITNNSDKEISIDLSSLDFKQADDPYGSVSFLGKELKEYSYALSSFLSFENNNLELGPREERKIEVTVTNRQDLSPGGHYAAVIVRQRPDEGDEYTVVTPALSSLVYLVKSGGERYNLSFKDVQFSKLPIVFSYPSTYFILLQNDGNIHLTPYGRADIKDMSGRLIYKGVINQNSIKVLPQSRRYIPIFSRKVAYQFPVSINSISITGRDSLDKTKFSYQDYFLYINPVFGVGLIITILIGVWIIKKRKSKNENGKTKSKK